MRMLKLLTRLTRLTMFIITFCWLHQNMIGNPRFVLNPYMFKGRYVPSPFKGMVSVGKGKVSHTCTLGIPVNNPTHFKDRNVYKTRKKQQTEPEELTQADHQTKN